MDSAPFKEGTVWSQRCVLSPRLFQSFSDCLQSVFPHTQDLLEGLINGDDGKVVGMELLYDAFQKSHAFFIVIIAFYDGHFKDEAAVILRPEGFHIGSILLQGLTGKGPLTFLETGIRSILEFADNGLTTIGKSLVLGPMQEVAI